MAKSIWMVYKTDPWHSYNSRDVIGIGTSKINAINLVKEKAEKEGYPFTKETAKADDNNVDPEWLLDFLSEKLQTQGYWGAGEFVIEELETDVLH